MLHGQLFKVVSSDVDMIVMQFWATFKQLYVALYLYGGQDMLFSVHLYVYMVYI